MFNKKRIGLALGGGGARGLAHIGVLKVLEKENIRIDMIAGTSMGAIIGALYSAEPNIKKIEKEVLDEKISSLLDYTISSKGIIKGKKIEEFLQKKLGNLEFKDLRIPLHVTAYDIENNQEIIFSRGNVAKAVRASISIPGIFPPVENQGKILVDGGIKDPIPSEILKEKKVKNIIASNVNYISKKKPLIDQQATLEKTRNHLPNILKISSKALQIVGSEISKADVKKPGIDLVININLENVGLLDFKDPKKIIQEGEKTAKKLIKEIKKLSKNPITRILQEIKEGVQLKK